jgi:hypothetical protein
MLKQSLHIALCSLIALGASAIASTAQPASAADDQHCFGYPCVEAPVISRDEARRSRSYPKQQGNTGTAGAEQAKARRAARKS